MYKVDHPRIVLQRAREFFNRHPHSKLRFDTEHLLAFALKDLWDPSVEGNDEFLTSDERANAESMRTPAILHFEYVFKHRRQLLYDPWKKVDDRILPRLRDRQDSAIGDLLIVD